MKSTPIKLTTILVSTLLFILLSTKDIGAAPTKWEDVTSSLSELLDSGWKVVSHGSNRVLQSSGVSYRNDTDEEMISFLLIKDEKYILCRIINPKTPIATRASCRKIN
jgi:hypothetical protein